MPVQLERSVTVQVWPLGGVEVRPTRVFVWAGPRRRLLRVIPLGGVPRAPRRPVRERGYGVGPVRGHHRGSPLVTVTQAGVRAAARAVRR
ncbi:MAG: hypothetical protein U0237_08435 [Thermoleophilia bacterium]